jgi:pilus assembly protein CpaB
MIAVAAVFGVLAVVLAQTWLNRQSDMRMRSLEAQQKPIITRAVVVARSPLRFGTVLTPQQLREVAWPGEAVPSGSFASIAELTTGESRVVLTSIEPNEPVVTSKITGPGQKATLSAVIQEGMKAVTVRVNEIDGVAGFVLPGDRVDVLVTRRSESDDGSTDVVLQSVRVLGIDQTADDRMEDPKVVKAVTLEVDTLSAQKLALAASIGNLSLVLRRAGDAVDERSRRVSISDIGVTNADRSAGTVPGGQTTVVVIRPDNREEFSVPMEPARPLQAGAEGRPAARQ